MSKSQKGSATIVIVVILVLLLGVAGYYYYSNRKTNKFVSGNSAPGGPFQSLKGAQVISPAGGQQWVAGSTHEIKWSGITKGTNVSINYQSPFETGHIAAVPNSGSYSWAISSTLRPSDKYYIIITTAGKNFDVAYSHAFTIVAAGTISDGNPNGNLPVESPQTVPNSSGGSAEVTCLTLPQDYRADIPVFAGGCLLQIVPITKNGTQSYAVFYEVAASGAEIMSFFDAGLTAKGWSPWAQYEKLIQLPPGMTAHGFQKSNYGLAVGVENNPPGKTHYYIGYNIFD